MLASITSLLSSGSIALVAAKVVIFLGLLSALLTAIGSALQALGDKVPGWLGDLISWSGSAVHFINGVYPPKAPPTV